MTIQQSLALLCLATSRMVYFLISDSSSAVEEGTAVKGAVVTGGDSPTPVGGGLGIEDLFAVSGVGSTVVVVKTLGAVVVDVDVVGAR